MANADGDDMSDIMSDCFIQLVVPQPVNINLLIQMVQELNAEWGPRLLECLLYKKPRGDHWDLAWSIIIVDMVESYVELNDAEKVYAIVALKRYYKV
jgi:hypothetical protein